MGFRSRPAALADAGRNNDIAMASGTPRWLMRHLLWPGLGFVVAIALLSPLGGDLWLADRLYAIQGHAWSLKNHVVLQPLFHIGGKHLSTLAWVAVVSVWLASWRVPSLREWRRALAFLWASVLMSTALVSVIKHGSHLDCPWDLMRYGGEHAYFGLFDPLPARVPAGSCFPAGHASAGYAWVALYFFLLARRPSWRWRGLAIGLIAGGVFGLAQQLRGAHFLSHDLWTLMICWSSALALYGVMLAPRRATTGAVADRTRAALAGGLR